MSKLIPIILADALMRSGAVKEPEPERYFGKTHKASEKKKGKRKIVKSSKRKNRRKR